jgi:hypothetical protein
VTLEKEKYPNPIHPRPISLFSKNRKNKRFKNLFNRKTYPMDRKDFSKKNVYGEKG